MVRLSVNVNKIATLRNARTVQVSGQVSGQVPGRSKGTPSVLEAARTCVDAGAPGITVHPRPDSRHITATDVRELGGMLAPLRDRVEFNIEGDPRPDLVALALEVRPHQFTLVPVRPGEVTSEAGWPADTDPGPLRELIAKMNRADIRVSVFVDPIEASIRWAAALGAQRIELYTEPYAKDVSCFDRYVAAARCAHALGLGINAGHDLDEANLPLFATLPHLDEVSIGHALIARAIYDGLAPVIRRYLQVLAGP